jgi:hypothetical protein
MTGRIRASVIIIALLLLFALAPGAEAAVSSLTQTNVTTPDTQSATAFGGASIRGDTDTTYTPFGPAGPTPSLIRAVIHFDDDFEIDATGVPICNPVLLAGTTTAQAIAACPGAQIGDGSETWTGPPAFGGTFPAVVTIFNGPPVGTDPTVLLHVRLFPPGFPPAGVTAVVTGVVSASTLGGDYGQQIDFVNPPSIPFQLTHIDLTLFELETSPGQFYFSARCGDPDQTWNVTVVNTYNDASTQSASSAQTCEVTANLPTDADQCKKGGWQQFNPPFKNQGDCVSFVATGGQNPPSG